MAGDGDKKKPSKWGKGKTDPATHWKKGCKSPNPKGRPKGSKNQKTLHMEAVQKKMQATIDGERTTMTAQQLAYHQLAQKSAAGDLKAISMQLQLDEKFDPPDKAPPTPEEAAVDYATLDHWVFLREKFKVFDLFASHIHGFGFGL